MIVSIRPNGQFPWWERLQMIVQRKPKMEPHSLSHCQKKSSQNKNKNKRRESQTGKNNQKTQMLRRLQFDSTQKTIPALRVIVSLFFAICSLRNYAQAHIFIYAGCSQEKFEPNSPFESNLNSLLASVVSSSSLANYNSFVIGNGTSTPSEGIAYGLYQCRGDLKTVDCANCVQNAVYQIDLVCSYSYGADLQLDDCNVRYEHTDFLGKHEVSLRYKKCSKSVNNHVEFFRSRDDVLADLQNATGFKVSCSGMVEGYVQCLGDLSSVDCTSCLAEAVGKLKNLCGSAAAADVFLGQCYARYWASGYFNSASDSSKQDDMGKTVAIIVGIIAGLAVLIVFLSVCRKAMG